MFERNLNSSKNILKNKRHPLSKIMSENFILSTFFSGLVILILELGRKCSWLKVNWQTNVDYEVVSIRVGVLLTVTSAIILLVYIFRNYTMIEKDLQVKVRISMTFLHVLAIVNIISEYINIHNLLNTIQKISTYLGIIFVPYFYYFILKTLDNINERLNNEKRLSQKLYKLSHTDKLTGLYNRSYLFTMFSENLKLHKDNNLNMGILFLDLDSFKFINDTYGHAFGDSTLIEVGKRLIESVRDNDIVSRIGGDEFVILVTNVKDKAILEDISKRIISNINGTICIDKLNFKLGVSIGISIFPEDGLEISQLLKNADKALYEIKNLSKNDYKFF